METHLSKLKEEITAKVVSELTDMRYMTSSEKERYKENLLSGINQKNLITTVRTQSGITNADDYNQTAFELYIDILTTFYYINDLYDSLNQHQMLNESIVNTLFSTIAGLNDKLDEYEAVIGTAGNPYCFIEGFRTTNFQELDSKYYTERYGEKMPLDTYAHFNSEQENITLGYTRQQNVMVYKSGVQLGEIILTKQYGAGFIKAKNSETKLENAIDTSMSTYWSETILADSELKIKGLEYDDATGLGKLNRSYYDLPRGAMCEICLVFEALAKINEITLRPYGNFPIDIIAIRYSLSDDEDDEIYSIVYPDNESYSWLNETSVKQEHTFHFPTISCKRLYILINQLHCIKSTYLMSCNQMFKNELWFNATYNDGSDANMPNTAVFKPLYLDRAADDAVWKYINNKLVSNDNIDINDLLINNRDKVLPVTKYQYTYGFYNIAPNFVEFQRAGIWVSQKIDCNGPIDTIRLETEEEHFYDSNGQIVTDIEFYVSTKDNPSYQDWKPICPINKSYVHNELLQLDYDVCYLRHPAVCRNVVINKLEADGTSTPTIEMERPVVTMNDITLVEEADYRIRRENPDDPESDVIAIEISNIDHFAMYTVSYTPADISKELTLIDVTGEPEPSNSFDEIMGNGTACYKLSGYPYYSKINPDSTTSFVKIIDMDTNKTYNQTSLSNSVIQCVTNKQCPADSYKNFNSDSNIVQYYTNGGYVYFNQPISSHQKIEINYPSFDCSMRLKAILRRNTKRDTWITPVLKSYKLMFTTI